jgi:hypothetical protein
MPMPKPTSGVTPGLAPQKGNSAFGLAGGQGGMGQQAARSAPSMPSLPTQAASRQPPTPQGNAWGLNGGRPPASQRGMMPRAQNGFPTQAPLAAMGGAANFAGMGAPDTPWAQHMPAAPSLPQGFGMPMPGGLPTQTLGALGPTSFGQRPAQAGAAPIFDPAQGFVRRGF